VTAVYQAVPACDGAWPAARDAARQQALPDDEIHVWRVGLDVGPQRLAALDGTLSPGERDRADRFVRACDSRRFVAARGVARALLGRYLGRAPASLTFADSFGGKPEVDVTGDALPLRFSYSRSHGVAVYALARRWRVGIDIEAIRPLDDLAGLVRQVCSERELELMQAQPPAGRLAAFYRLWVRKEAVVKATGEGLARDLRGVEVGLSGDAVRLLADDGEAGEPAPWRLVDLPAGAGHASALAVEGSGTSVRTWLEPTDR
jgi:4'-phosphopantetheinyl transferase